MHRYYNSIGFPVFYFYIINVRLLSRNRTEVFTETGLVYYSN